jgi:voltage-gated potassium channel
LPAIRWLRFLRLARLIYVAELARLLRLGVLVRLLVQVNRIGNEFRSVVVRNGVHVFLTLAVGLVVIGGSLTWELEHTVNPSFRSYPDALWWAFATMTTVGYGNGPVTPAGRVIAGIVMITGIACFGVITATVTALFLRQRAPDQGDQSATPDEIMAALEDIRARLARIEKQRAQRQD